MVLRDSYPFGKNVLPECDYSPEAIHYKFTHNLGPNPTNKWYSGMHGLKEYESAYDGSYWNSSTDKNFKNLLETNPEEFTYEILNFGSMQEMFKAESLYLTKHKARTNKKSWNKTNGIDFQTVELPRLALIDELAREAYNPKNPNKKNMKVVDLLSEDLIKLQVRFETNLSRNKIKEYKDRMVSENSTKSFTITIVVSDGKWIIVGGNHTLEGILQAKMSHINVVFIYEDLSIDELYALGSALNRKDDIDRMNTEISTIARDLVKLFNAKKITDPTFKTKWCTDYMKVTGNLVGKELTACRKEAVDMIEEKASWKEGKRWKNWKLQKSKQTADDKCKALTNDTTFVTWYSGTMFDPDRVVSKWMEDSLVRIENGLEPRSNITVYLHWSTKKSFTEWSNSDEWDKNEETLTMYMYGFIHKKTEIGVDNFTPNVKYKKLEQWEDDVS
tara:strand:+ start:1200 stop:2534 length:1335 start_codon:yes stop_codon:yes gene_type:complete